MRKVNKHYPLSQLATAIGGEILGDPTRAIGGLTALEIPIPGHITFVRSQSPSAVLKHIEKLSGMAVIVPRELTPSTPPPAAVSIVSVKDSYAAFLNLIPLFYEEEQAPPGIHPSACIDPSATVGEGASVGPFTHIGARCVIGKNARIYPSVTIYNDVTIGDSVTLFTGVSLRSGTVLHDRITIHDKAVIGADGFGYTPDSKVGLRKVPQLGNVIIESDVEIGANTCIDRGAFGPTKIGRGTKIDNLVQIGHNAQIGAFCIICGGSAIAGSTKIHDRVVVGGSVGIADHVEIVSGVRLGGRSGVTTSLMEPGDYMGFPAVKASEWRRAQVLQRKALRKGKDS